VFLYAKMSTGQKLNGQSKRACSLQFTDSKLLRLFILVVSNNLCKPPLSGKIKNDDGGKEIWQGRKTADFAK